MARMRKLSLEQRQVHIRRALDRARFAGETVAQRGIELFRAKGVVLKTQLQRGADRVGPAAGGHVFLAGGEKGGTHRGRVLAAASAAVALLEIAEERFILEREGEHRLEGKP